jgi:hypothetical protein
MNSDNEHVTRTEALAVWTLILIPCGHGIPRASSRANTSSGSMSPL